MSVKEEEKYFDYKLEPGREQKRQNLEIENPLISIITAYYNSKDFIMQTANSVFNQTFPYWEWIIVNDGSPEEGTEEVLNRLQSMDKRIRVINIENKGRIIARDMAIAEAKTELIYILDSDDLIDPTTLETSYWTLMTNPKASWAYTDVVNFEGEEFLWKREFDCETEKQENLLTISSLIRKKDILAVGGYNAVDKDVHEDWHLWLRMLEKGYYPVHMSFYGFWYRKKKNSGTLNSIEGNKAKAKHSDRIIKEQAKKIKHNVMAVEYPTTTGSGYDTYPYTFDWDREPINKKGEKINLLFFFPWFKIGGADKFNYDLISRLDKEKYNVTIVTTEPCDYIWRQKFEEHAEVFDLTSFLHRKDWSAFIHYLMKTRSIDLVMQSNSFYGFYVLPWLKAEFPDVVFTDYIHCENWSWRNGEYPRESTAISSILDMTYTCTKNVADIMVNDMARKHDNIKTVYIGVDPNEYDETKVNIEDCEILKKYQDKYKDKKVILYLARIVEEKRPIFAIHVLKELCKNRKDIMLFVVGNGNEFDEMQETVKKFGLEDNVIFFGMQNDTKPFYKVADVHIICSLTEGLTITTYESLAMGTPVVTADVGGQKELVDDSCGAVVQNIQNAKDDFYNRNYTEEEITRYANAITKIIDNPEYDKIKQNCRQKIQKSYTLENMAKIMDEEFTRLVKNGTKVNKDFVKENWELYRQYLVIFNEVDKRNYNNPNGGIGPRRRSRKLIRLKYRLWNNPLWRLLVRFLQVTGLMKLIKKAKMDRAVKDIVIKITK